MTLIPSKFKVPQLDQYDGTGDPVSHVSMFRTKMMLQNVNDAILCRVFPATLTNTAQRWFHRLLKNSISTFEELIEQFRTRFITNISPKKSINDLRLCKQDDNETLRSYLDRFNKIAMQIEHLSNELAIDALKFGTKLRKLRDKITTKKPQTFSEAMAIATKLIDLDEDRRDMQKKDDERVPKQREERRESRRDYSSKKQRSDDNKYAPLNTPRSEILM